MDILHMIGGPAVGALIGYCTNYIAVKMLFRPLRPIKIGNYVLPFTPGIIPKRKPALAKALGNAVGNTLLTADDLKNTLLSDEVKNTVSTMLINQLQEVTKSKQTVKDIVLSVTDEEQYLERKEKWTEEITNRIMDNLEKLDIGNIVVTEGKKAVREKMSGSFVSMFLNDDLMDSLAQPIGEAVEQYLYMEGRDYIEPLVSKELDDFSQNEVGTVVTEMELDFMKISHKIEQWYEDGIEKFATPIVEQFHISDIVEQKVNEMPVEDLEQLVLSVMKHELQMVVNLGALIGLVLGVLNILF